MEICPKCESDKIISDARVLDHAHYSSDVGLHVAVDENPTAWIMKDTETSKVSAQICGNCGYVELYALDPDALYQAFLASKQNQ
jgi:hypothetical protein